MATDTRVPEPSSRVGQSHSERVLYVLAPWFYPLYARALGRHEQFVLQMRRRLAAANLAVPVEIYLAGTLGMGALAGVAVGCLFAAGVATGLVPTPTVGGGYVPDIVAPLAGVLDGPLFVAVGLTVGVVVGVVSALAAALVVPRVRAYQRRREINLLLPDTVAFMYALSVGGAGHVRLIAEVADSENTYGEVAVAFRRIHDEMTYFNRDYRSAVERVAAATPSDPLESFLTDLLSVVNSGGDLTRFLEAEKDHQLQAVQQSQQARLDVLELFGQAYLSLSTVPMFALIVFVLMSMLGDPKPVVLFSVVYGLIPGLNLLFVVLLSTAKKDEPGTGTLSYEDGATLADAPEQGPLSFDVAQAYADRHEDPVFDQIRRREIRRGLAELASPSVVRDRPAYTLAVTVPLALAVLAVEYGLGLLAPLSPSGVRAAFLAAPVTQTTAWVLLPGAVVLAPLAGAVEWRHRSRAAVTGTMTADVRKMANANEAGNSVLESIRIAAEDNPSRLAGELRRAHRKVQYGHSLSDSLVELTNRYRRPRLARSIKLIERAQRASDRITGVLRTAAKLSETRDELDAEYDSRMLQQVAILTVTFLVLLGILAFLRVFFVPTIGDLVANSGSATEALTGSTLDRSVIDLLYFHAALLQAAMTGLVTGYIRRTSLLAGLKYVVVYTLLTAVVWGVLT